MRSRGQFLLSIAIITLISLLGISQLSIAQRKAQPSPKAKPRTSDPAVKTPSSADTFSTVLFKLLSSAPNGFLALRKTGSADSRPVPGSWETDVRFPGAFTSCSVFASGELSQVFCQLPNDSQPSSATQAREDSYEHYCEQLVRLLPANCVVNLEGFESLTRQQTGALPFAVDAELRFFAPESEKVFLQVSKSSMTFGTTSIWLSVYSGAQYNSSGGQTLGELRSGVPTGESAIITIRQKARLYNSKSLQAEMLLHLNRYREAAALCSSLAPAPWFCGSVNKEAAHPLSADVDGLYESGDYERALIASTLAIQRTRNLGPSNNWKHC